MTTYPRAWVTRIEQARKPLYEVEVLNEDTGKNVKKGQFQDFEQAVEYAERIAETVVRIGV